MRRLSAAIAKLSNSIPIPLPPTAAKDRHCGCSVAIKEAEKALNKAIQLDPKSVWTYNELGALYTDEKQYENAVVEYDKALTIDPNYKYAYAKAFPLRMLGHYQEAVAALTKAIEIDPSWTWPYIERASIFHDHLFQYDSAYHDLEKASQTSNTLGYPG